MKRRKGLLGILITIATLVFGLAVFTACGEEDDDKLDYSITVLAPDETPLADVTVSWNVGARTAGSAKTGADGKATASLSAGTYTVALSDFYEGYSFESFSVSAAQRNATVSLSAIRVTYSVSVTDKDGEPAENVTVVWTKGNTSNSAKTNGNGLAVKELDYNEYTVTLSIPKPLSETNIYERPLTVNGSDPFVAFDLIEGHNVDYTVKVRSEGGLPFKEQAVQVFNGTVLMSSGETDENGEYRFSLMQGHYSATAPALPDGYTAREGSLTPLELSCEVVLHSEVIREEPAANKRYVMGDIVHDYTFTTPYQLDGAVWSKSVAELLKTKKAILINNWGMDCSWCVKEMPAMAEAYEKYSDKIEMIAVNNFSGRPDTDKEITDYYNSNGYPFPMMRDEYGFTAKFGITGWPTTVVIDRYGAIVRIESGAIADAEVWGRLIEKYIGDDYVQDFVPGETVSDPITTEVAKPDIELDPDHYEKVAEAMNDRNNFPVGASVEWFGDTGEYMWPFILGVESDLGSETVLYASNIGKANSMAVIHTRVNVAAGKVLVFDYYSQTEENDDVLSVILDGKTILKEISGTTDGWQTVYLYTNLIEGEHMISFAYIKDSSGNVGKDTVYFKNVRFADIEDIQGSADMLRSAAYGTPAEGQNKYPYYADVAMGADGYYHVVLSSLQNSEYAGTDESPLLLVNLMNVTQWASQSISRLVTGILENGEYAVAFPDEDRDALIDYLAAAAASDIPGFAPVNQELHDLLVAFMASASGETSHASEWLEACYFYSHYGTCNPVGNPILGLMEQTAIPITEGTTTADITRNTFPFPTVIFTFTPEASAVYKLESMIPVELAASKMGQVWLYDDATSASEPLAYCGDTRVVRDGVNEHNFELYYYMTAGHKYYVAVAYQMSESGVYDFKVTRTSQSEREFVPASGDTYTMDLDEDGKFTGDIYLAGAVKYVKDADGYYHALNPDGTVGDFLYLDVKYASTTALGTIPITRLVDKYVQDPANYENLSYKFFDFTHRVGFYSSTVDGESVVDKYDPEVDVSSWGAKYRDYTDTVKKWIADAEKSDGLIKVTQEIVDVLQLYIETRVNSMTDNVTERVLDNEWLRFCWYSRLHDCNNP